MSFEKVEFNFEEKCYVITGNNLDNEGQKSNGSGKTSFADLIAVALLGYSLTGRSLKDCANWSTDKGFFTVELAMENAEQGQTCNISRKIYSNTKSGELVILFNGLVPKTLPTKKGVENGCDVKEGDKYILETILDLKADDLLNYYLISGKYYQPFLRINTDKKLEVINRFSKASVVDKAIAKLELEQEVGDDSIREYQDRITSIDGYIQALQDSLHGDAKKAWEELKQERINNLEEDAKEQEDRVLTYEEDIGVLKKGIETLTKSLVEFDPEDLAYFECQMDLGKKDAADIVKKRREIDNTVSHIEKHLAGLVTCPECNHQFSLTSDKKYTQADLIKAKKELTTLQKNEKEKDTSLLEIKEEIYKLEQTRNQNTQLKQDIASKERGIRQVREQQERGIKEFERILIEIDKAKASTFDDERKHIAQQIEEKLAERREQDKQLLDVQKELEQTTQWINHFEDFRFYLANKPLEIICGLVNQYLAFNGSDLNLHIEGFKKLKSGEIRQALQPVIYRNWANPKDYNQFSEGEKTRLNLAVDLSFQQLINSSSKSGGLDYYCNDELMNPLDSVGVQGAAKAFNQLGKTILLVSQAGADLVYDNTVLIEKENGISKII